MQIDTYELLRTTEYSAHMLWYGIECLDKSYSMNPPFEIVTLRDRLMRKFKSYPKEIRAAARSVARDYMMDGYSQLEWRR